MPKDPETVVHAIALFGTPPTRRKVCTPSTLLAVVEILYKNGQASGNWARVTCLECLRKRSTYDFT